MDAEQLWHTRPFPTNSHIDPKKPTVVYLHGFTEVAPGESGSALRDGQFEFLVVVIFVCV